MFHLFYSKQCYVHINLIPYCACVICTYTDACLYIFRYISIYINLPMRPVIPNLTNIFFQFFTAIS